MIFPFINKPQPEFILMITYHHSFGNGISSDESAKLAEQYRNVIKGIEKKLPKNVLLIDLPILVKDDSKIDVQFFSLTTYNNVENQDLKTTITALKKILKNQFEKTEINEAKEFFEYEA